LSVIWEEKALFDIAQLRDYIALDKPKAAQRMALRVVQAGFDLGSRPDAGRPGRVYGTRPVVLTGTPYLIVFTVLNGQIRILALMHGAGSGRRSFSAVNE